MLYTFDSVEEFAKTVQETVQRSVYPTSSWTAHISFDQAVDFALRGDESYAAEATKLIDQLEVDMPETKTFGSIRSPFGGRVNLGDWLAGAPAPMRRRVRRVSEFAPIKVVVSTTSSANIDAAVMQKRGAAILALLLKLQQIRPIQLYLLSELFGEPDGWNYQFIRVESQPLATGVAAFTLCNVGFARHLCYSYGFVIQGFDGTWPRGYGHKSYVKERAERLSLSDQDLFIKEAYAGDEMIKKPLEWLKSQLEKFGVVE